MIGRQCSAKLENGQRCKRKASKNSPGCSYHPAGIGPGDRKNSTSHPPLDSRYAQNDFVYNQDLDFDKYDIEPEDILLPTKEDYYASTEKKHFGDTSAPGSQFTEVKSLKEFLKLAQEQKPKGLADDDSQWYIDNGVDPGALRENTRYIRVDTPGVLGSGDSTKLQDDDIVIPIRKSTSKGANEYRFTFEIDEKPKVDHATLIISDDVDGYDYSPEMLEALDGEKPPAIFFTCYPGSPGGYRGGVRDEKLEKLEKRLENNPRPLTVKEVKRDYFDGKDFGVNYSTKR